ncbi:hypothetical protein ACEZ2D_003555 [Escherichia coli]
MSIKNDGHYFCRAGGNRPDGLNEPVTFDYELYMKTNMGSTKNGARVPHVRNRFTSMDIGMNSQILPDMLINFALINITDRKNEGTNTIDGNWQADEGRRYRDNVRIYF